MAGHKNPMGTPFLLPVSMVTGLNNSDQKLNKITRMDNFCTIVSSKIYIHVIIIVLSRIAQDEVFSVKSQLCFKGERDIKELKFVVFRHF